MRFPLTWLALGALCGCLADTSLPNEGAQNVDRSAAPFWHVRATQSGGFAGLAQEFEIDSATATIVAHDRARGVSASRALTGAELAGLEALAAAAAREPPEDGGAAPTEFRCADCVETELQGVHGERRFAARADINPAVRSHGALIGRILELGQPLLESSR